MSTSSGSSSVAEACLGFWRGADGNYVSHSSCCFLQRLRRSDKSRESLPSSGAGAGRPLSWVILASLSLPSAAIRALRFSRRRRACRWAGDSSFTAGESAIVVVDEFVDLLRESLAKAGDVVSLRKVAVRSCGTCRLSRYRDTL